jgi:hypothetical protein
MYDIVVSGPQPTGTVLCRHTWPATQATNPVPEIACDGCDFAIMTTHTTGTTVGAYCDTWYTDASWLDGTEAETYVGGIGYHPSHTDIGGPGFMYYFAGSSSFPAGWYPSLATDSNTADIVDTASWATFVARSTTGVYDFEYNHVLDEAYSY